MSPGRTFLGCGGREEQRPEKEAESERRKAKRKRSYRDLSRLSPITWEQKDANNGARGRQLTPFFICWWVGSDSGRQPVGEKEVALPADAKKDQSSHPCGPLHLQQLPLLYLHLAPKIPRAFSGTESRPSCWHQAQQPISGAGQNPAYSQTGLAPPPPSTTPWITSRVIPI